MMNDFIFTKEELPAIRQGLQLSIKRLHSLINTCDSDDIKKTYEKNLYNFNNLLTKVLTYEGWGKNEF